MGECGAIRVVASAEDDSIKISLCFLMKADEIEAVQGDDGPVLLLRVGEHLIVWNFLVCPSGFIRRENIMP